MRWVTLVREKNASFLSSNVNDDKLSFSIAGEEVDIYSNLNDDQSISVYH